MLSYCIGGRIQPRNVSKGETRSKGNSQVDIEQNTNNTGVGKKTWRKYIVVHPEDLQGYHDLSLSLWYSLLNAKKQGWCNKSLGILR